MLQRRDVADLYGVPVTTPLRTACDLGRLLWKYDAIAAIDAALSLSVRQDDLLLESVRFKGFRGVRQLRALVPLGDPRSESPGESALRLRWLEAGLPAPVPQYEIVADEGWVQFRLDLAAPDVRYAAEYDGVEFHSKPADQERDLNRRRWLRDEAGWTLDAFTKKDVFGASTRIHDELWTGFCNARRAVTRWAP